jgi:5-methylcytosine-specific restriction endonuclease McrA
VVHHRTYLAPQNIHNPELTLNWANLEALCQDCHNREHHRGERRSRYEFDENGNIKRAEHDTTETAQQRAQKSPPIF